MRSQNNATPQSVTLILDTLARAGSQVQTKMLAVEMASKGIRVTVLLLEHPAHQPLPDLPSIAVLRVPVGPLNSWGALGQFLVLWRILRGLRPDVVHTFLFKANLVGTLAARLAGVPVVVGSRRSMGYDLNNRRSFLSRLFNRLVDGVVVNARAIISSVEKKEGGSLPCPIVIPNGVEFPANILPVKNSPARRVGILANIRPVKGHDVALDAFALVLEKEPEAELCLMGDREGDPSWVKTIELQAQRLGVEKRIVWYDPNNNKSDFFADIDVLVSSSRSEGLSNAILESMAAGVPVVATDVGGTPEALGNAGVLVEPGDHDALAVAIIDLLQDFNRRMKLVMQARRRAETLFDPETMVETHLHWYGWLLETARRPRWQPRRGWARRRVIISIDLLDTGGTETQVRHWVRGLMAQGIPVTVFCLREGGRVADELAAEGADIRVLGKRRRFDPLFLIRQQWLLWRLRPKTLLALLTTAGIWSVPAARLANTPHVIFSMRATALTDNPDHEGPVGLLSRSLGLAHSVVGNSPEVLTYCHRKLNVSPEKTILLPNVIAGAHLSAVPRTEIRESLNLSVGAPLFGIVARLVPVKDHDLFLDVCGQMKKLMPGAQALIIGDGPEKSRLESEIIKRKLSAHVRMLGHRTDVSELARALDAVVLTSRSEGSPNSVLEALAVGTPVVSVNVGDVGRIVGTDQGQVVEGRDPGLLAAALVSVLNGSKIDLHPHSVHQRDSGQVLFRLKQLVSGLGCKSASNQKAVA